MIQYIASDLDGTILHHPSDRPDQELFDLILKLKKKGIHFIAASGRQYANMYRLFGPIQDEISYIAENGSFCMHNQKVVCRGEISRELGYRIIDSVKDFPNAHLTLACDHVQYTDSKDSEFVSYLSNVLDYNIEVIDDLKKVKDPFLKFAICDMNGNEKIAPIFQDMFSKDIKVVTSGNIWIDFIAPNANKGTALQKMCDYLGVSIKNGIAFGDQFNDLEMLQMAGTGYAMKTCAPGVEKYADGQVDSVKEVLRKIVNDEYH